MNNRDTVLIIEDDEKAAIAIADHFEKNNCKVVCMAAVDEMTGPLIKGRDYRGEVKDVSISMGRVSEAFVDYQIYGKFNGSDVVLELNKHGVPSITAISSSRPYNERMLKAGATHALLKPDFLKSLMG
jgi:DNA-binding response OmpR family regulator